MAKKEKGSEEPETTTEDAGFTLVAPEDVPTDPQATDEPPLDAVVVFKRIGDDGTLSVEAAPNGNVQITEVETLLGLALKAWRERYGLA